MHSTALSCLTYDDGIHYMEERWTEEKEEEEEEVMAIHVMCGV